MIEEEAKKVKARSVSKAKSAVKTKKKTLADVAPLTMNKSTLDCLKILSKHVLEKDPNKIIDKLILFYANRVNLNKQETERIINKMRL